MRNGILHHFHDSTKSDGHFGVEKILARTKQSFGGQQLIRAWKNVELIETAVFSVHGAFKTTVADVLGPATLAKKRKAR